MQIKNEGLIKNLHLTDVGNTGFEPVTSCLSSKRSKPTELIAQVLIISKLRDNLKLSKSRLAQFLHN